MFPSIICKHWILNLKNLKVYNDLIIILYWKEKIQICKSYGSIFVQEWKQIYSWINSKIC